MGQAAYRPVKGMASGGSVSPGSYLLEPASIRITQRSRLCWLAVRNAMQKGFLLNHAKRLLQPQAPPKAKQNGFAWAGLVAPLLLPVNKHDKLFLQKQKRRIRLILRTWQTISTKAEEKDPPDPSYLANHFYKSRTYGSTWSFVLDKIILQKQKRRILLILRTWFPARHFSLK